MDLENAEFIAELESKFPLMKELRFYRGEALPPLMEALPPLIALLSAMSDPCLEGDVCVILPSRERVAVFVAVLSALSATKDHFPELLKEYIQTGFVEGERVRALPSGDVFEFAGFFTDQYSHFFKLKLMGSGGGARSFPIGKAVFLEKTTRKLPRASGRTKLDAIKSVPIDEILNIETAGNQALLRNEIMLVTKQSEFMDFMNTVFVCRANRPDRAHLLKDVISWGIVNHEGDFEFRGSAAAAGAPMIAVASRTEYAAEACRKHEDIDPRVIIDGAIRIKDLQSFDDIVDFSKLLVIADHTRLDDFQSFEERNCTIWKLPDKLGEFAGDHRGLFKRFSSAYRNASEFNINIINCDSEPCDGIARRFRQAEKILKESEADPEDLKLLGIAYSRLIDIAGIVHIPTDESVEQFLSSLEAGQISLQGRRLYIDQVAHDLLNESYGMMQDGLRESSSAYRIDKQQKLNQLVKTLQANNSKYIVLAPTIFSAESARVFLNQQLGLDVRVSTITAIADEDVFDDIVLTGWPKSRYLEKLLNRYVAANIHALAYSFESTWFSQSRYKRARQLLRWENKEDQLAQLTGINRPLVFSTPELPPVPPADEKGIFETETLLDGLKKGTASRDVDELEARAGKYLGFAGSAYGYMTKTHKIPKITGLINGTLGLDERIPLIAIDDLEVGDFVMFRAGDGSQNDLIRQIAEQTEGIEKYHKMRKTSERWKSALLEVADNLNDIVKELHGAGMTLSDPAIRGWLTDPARIGPQYREDLETIALCTGDQGFINEIDGVWGAIKYVRGAHQAAGTKLSKLLIEHLRGQLPEIDNEETIVDLVLGDLPLGNVLIVQIEDIADEYETRSYLEVNHVLFEH